MHGLDQVRALQQADTGLPMVGRRLVGRSTRGEREKLLTAVMCMISGKAGLG